MARTTILPGCSLHHHEVRQDPRGNLVALEFGREIPFQVERIYFLYGAGPGQERGFHAHRTLQQWAVCVAGACTVLLDDGRARVEVRLDSPDRGLHIEAMIWRELKAFSPESVLMVLASAPYDPDDYIRDYESFIALTANG